MANPATPKTGVVVLPPGAPIHAAAARAAEEAGLSLWPADRAPEAPVAVVDATSDEGLKALGEAASDAGQLRSIVAVVDWKDAARASKAGECPMADLVDRSVLHQELPFRLRKAEAAARAREEARQRERDLSLLLQLTADYAASLDVQQLLHDVTRRLAQEMGVLRASLVVLDEQREAGFVIAASDDAELRELRIELSRYPEIRECVRTGQPVLVADVPTHPLLEGVKSQVAARGIHAIAALPLSLRGKVLGVLLLRAAAGRPQFAQREIDFLATVAHATAVALRNVRLLETERGQTAREKSARIAAEERASQLQRYESYFASMSEGIAILDEKACLLLLNPAGAKMLDVTQAEALGRHINALTNPTDDGVLMDVLWSISRGEVRREIDLAARTVAGRKLTLSVCAAPIREGEASSIVSFRDDTVQRQMAEELRHTKEFLERLIDSSVDAIIAADLAGKIILFNKGAEQVTGYTAEEALSRLNIRDLYPAGVSSEVMTRLRSNDEGGRGRLTVTRQELINKKGERVPVNMTAAILYEGERETATVGVYTDLRDKLQLERKLSDAETRLEESERNAVIVALAGTAAHELNQPLTSVMGYAELLKRKLKEDDFSFRPVDIIYREAERMAENVRKIGKITRYETKSYIGQAKILDLDKASSH
ncbi:MAG TPA: PAS domain S-box protein, partial [Myxococcales bacterium]|nr:PAS domain S-box protein [Myxococcales bacterium]